LNRVYGGAKQGRGASSNIERLLTILNSGSTVEQSPTQPSRRKLTLREKAINGTNPMIFIGKLIAVALVGFGILNIGVGLWIAENTATMVENAQLSARYLATENSGDGIDRGMIMVGIGVVFGLLTKIAQR